MLKEIKIHYHQGSQYIHDIRHTEVPGIFKGRPAISEGACKVEELVELCPTSAITSSPFSIDLGKCTFCGACAFHSPHKIKFTKDYHLSVNQQGITYYKRRRRYSLAVRS